MQSFPVPDCPILDRGRVRRIGINPDDYLGPARAADIVAMYSAFRSRAFPLGPICALPRTLLPDSRTSGTAPAQAAAASAEAQAVKFKVPTSSQAVVITLMPVMLRNKLADSAHAPSRKTVAISLSSVCICVVSSSSTASSASRAPAVIELLLIAWVRNRFMQSRLLPAVIQIIIGGLLVFLTGVLIGTS
jgi:hypothetical protein